MNKLTHTQIENELLKLNNWNLSNVNDMQAMFYRALDFNQPIGDWDVSNVTEMGVLFWGCMSFDQDITNWDVSNVVNMFNMFQQTIYSLAHHQPNP